MTARTATDSRFTVGLAPEPSSIAIARSIVRRLTVFVSDDAASSYLTALTEVLANAIDEHQAAEVDADIVMTVVFGERDWVSVADRGRGLDHSTRPNPPGPPRPDSDRGLILARAFVERLALESTAQGTTATLPLSGHGIVR